MPLKVSCLPQIGSAEPENTPPMVRPVPIESGQPLSNLLLNTCSPRRQPRINRVIIAKAGEGAAGAVCGSPEPREAQSLLRPRSVLARNLREPHAHVQGDRW